jgi:hypothetical protein
LLKRITWLVEHDLELQEAHKSRIRLRGLLRVVYSVRADFTAEELVAVIDATTVLLGHIAPYGPIERVTDYLKQNDLTPELCRAMRAFQANLTEQGSESQASLQSLRQTLHMLLWMDEWEPLDPARCWSECVRRDFRQMTGEQRQRWRTLLKHLRGNAPVRMPKGWAAEARPLVDAVGLDDFQAKIESWFAPFRSGQALPLSVAGSHVLKGLIWYCAVTGDGQLKACALWLLDAQWRQKRNKDKSLVALMELGITREELEDRNLINVRAPDPMPRFIEKLKSALSAIPTNRVAHDEESDLVIIQGQMHFYRLYRSSGRIERATDNAVLELNWHALPDQFRLVIGPEPDSGFQIEMRAFMLMHDGVFAQYFREKPGTGVARNKGSR